MPLRSQRIRTLVVDDSSISRKTICAFLEDEKSVEIVGTAFSGDQALDEVETLRPELVLLDVQMPAMNGLEVTEQLRKRFPSTRVILLSVDDSQEVRMSCEASGADGFVSKSQLPELSREIRRMFQA